MIRFSNLSQFAKYVSEKIDSSDVAIDDFVSVNNLLPNKRGLTRATVLPKGKLNAFQAGDILVGNIRPYLKKIWRANRPGGCSPDVLVFRCTESSYSAFLYYCLFRDDFFAHMMRGKKGTKMPRGDKDQILSYPVPIIEPERQKEIGQFLSLLDSKISFNNRINAEFEAMVKTIYDYWFVQFDFPISKEQAKAIGKPNLEGKPYKASGGKMLWNENLKTEVPEGWEVTELGRYIISNRGVSYSGKEIEGDGISMINLNSFNTNSTYKIDGIKSFSGSYNRSKVLKPYDLVMCNTQQTSLDPKKDVIGKSFLVPDIFKTEIVSSHHVTTIGVRTDELKYYLNSLFNSEHFHRYISGYCTGTKILGLNFDGVLSYQTAIPANNVLSNFKSLISDFERRKSISIKENQRLMGLRDWLLPMLMNGQVSVGMAKAQSIVIPPSVKITPELLQIPEQNRPFAKQVLGGKIVSLFRADSNFTHIKFQKLQYLAEHLAQVDLDWNYYRQSAGPYDPKFMHTVAARLKSSKWFEERRYKFYPLEKANKIDGYYQGYFSQVESKLSSLFSLLKSATEDESEIVATLYAVWNNMIIKKELITDDRIISEFFEWSDRKKKYTKAQLVAALGWMRSNNIVPSGFGKIIKERKR